MQQIYHYLYIHTWQISEWIIVEWMKHTWKLSGPVDLTLVQAITKSTFLADFILFINIIKTLIYNGQQEKMISNAISNPSASLLIAPALKNGQFHSNGVLVCSSTQLSSFFSHTLMYKAVVVTFWDRSQHAKQIIWWKDATKELSETPSQTKHVRSPEQVEWLHSVFILSLL